MQKKLFQLEELIEMIDSVIEFKNEELFPRKIMSLDLDLTVSRACANKYMLCAKN